MSNPFNKSSIKLLTGIILFSIFFSFGTVPALAQSTVEILIHHIDAKPIEGELAYDVSVFVSVFDNAGTPRADLSENNFTVREDGQEVVITSIGKASSAPINVVLVLDASGSMARKMTAARQAAQEFVQTLGPNDKVALIVFDSTVNKVFDLTSDFSSAISALNSVTFTPNGGTCLYDAAYEAVELANTADGGRRAVVLLTDGVDMTADGEICSSQTVDNVIDRATRPTSLTPIFSVGLGKPEDLDERGLTKLSNQTGGRYTSAANTDELAVLFPTISRQLNSQTVIQYVSTQAPGTHSLVVQAIIGGTSDQALRDFNLPGLPPTVSIDKPADEEETGKSIDILATIIERGIPVDRVVFTIDDVDVFVASNSPYKTSWDFGEDYGPKAISVTAYGKDGSILNQQSITIDYPDPGTNDDGSKSTKDDDKDQDGENELTFFEQIKEQLEDIDQNTWYIIIGAVVALIVIIIVGVVFSRRKKKGADAPAQMAGMDDATVDGMSFLSTPEAKLIVEHSDDASMVGQEIMLMKFPASMGRSANNDVVFPKDTPVSREHATIEKIGSGFLLKEVIKFKDGVSIGPKYGTYLDDQKIDGTATLSHDTVIQLGPRLKFRFKSLVQDSFSSDDNMDRTFDDMDGLSLKENDDTLDDNMTFG